MWSASQATARPDHFWTEIWSDMSKTASRKGKATMGYRKTKARQCNHREKVGNTDGGGLCPSSGGRSVPGSCGKPTTRLKNPTKSKNTKHAFIVEAHGSTNKRLESTPPKDHEDQITVKGFKFAKSLQLGAHVCSHATSEQNSGRESSSGQGMEETRKVASMQ